ncbi:MAG: TraB/GumN family protein [Chlorobi bacterium]|nr:TraB/GumN family protein [Chlorobiota bacterium]
MEKIEHGYGSDVDIVEVKGKRFVIIGTAHVSKESAELVRTVIEQEKPDKVCVELDEQRYKALSQKKKWESLDIKQVIKQKQLSTLIINIILASYQKKIGEQLGVMPGTELLEAAKTAEEMGIPIALADRDVRTTLKRAWSSMTFWQKLKFLSSGLAGVFDKEEITEEKLTELREKDALNELLSELGREMPILKRVLIDERDSYISTKMQSVEEEKIVSVVGAGHKEGIIKALEKEEIADLEEISVIPPPSPWVKIIGWGIPAIIIASLFYIGFTKGSSEAGDNVLFWILANGIPSALGALIAYGHPLTVVASFLAAPITSLTPVIGAGYVAAFVQAYIRPPIVKEFHTVTDDVSHVKLWWKNRLLRILLVFILSGLGSAIGTYVGAYKIVQSIF